MRLNDPSRSPLATLALLALLALPWQGTAAAVSIYLSPEALAERSPWIVEARVVAADSGFDPETGRLDTYVSLDVETVHRGPAPVSRLVLREAGGRLGQLVHETDAVPVYRVGEHVVAFLEPAPDGALRTSGMFFGKFVVDADAESHTLWATRELEGQGTILRRPTVRSERLPLSDLVSLAASVPYRPGPHRVARRAGPERSGAARAPRWSAVPPEYGRLIFAGAVASGTGTTDDSTTAGSAIVDPARTRGDEAPIAAFVPLSATYPTRWTQSDTGGGIAINVDRTGNPLGDGAAAAAEMARAMAAWTEVPEARVSLVPANTDLSFVPTHAKSPAVEYSGTNVILFDDPYDDISDPSGCSGVLAIGGYWRTTSKTSTINGVSFYAAKQLYVIFNNDFECVLGDPDNLAEIATHELGHGLGLGHSTVKDAIMRSAAYLDRGPRLGDDDRDAVHCVYPHTFGVLSPAATSVWEAGSVQRIDWQSTAESGPDAGTVDLQLTTDGGQSWVAIAEAVPNDGSYAWLVPDSPTDQAAVRVSRRSRTGLASPPFPEVCSSATSGGTFSIVPHQPLAGAVGSGPQDGLRLVKSAGSDGVSLSWGASCSAEATDYAIYEGSLDELRLGTWNPVASTCSTGGDPSLLLQAAPGNRYFLVAPLSGSSEGTYGRGAGDELRPPAPSACAPRETVAACE